MRRAWSLLLSYGPVEALAVEGHRAALRLIALTMRQYTIIQVDANGEFQLPDDIMDRHGWQPGLRLMADLIPGGLLLRGAPNEDDRGDGHS